MTTKLVPQVYVHECDACAASVTQPDNKLPPKWFKLSIVSEFYRYPNEGDVARILCQSCGDDLRKAINAAMPAVRV